MTENQPKEPTLVFNDKPYPISSLSKETVSELQSLRFAEQEVARLKAKLAVAQTAAKAYKRSLGRRLENETGGGEETDE